MDSYFRQSWVDQRLSFSGYKASKTGLRLIASHNFHFQSALALSIEMLSKIWKPDTFVYNGKRSYLHTITTPNRFVRYATLHHLFTIFWVPHFRLFPNGRVLYSQRLTIRATCHMNLEDFPMDRQACPLKIGSCNCQAQPQINSTLAQLKLRLRLALFPAIPATHPWL